MVFYSIHVAGAAAGMPEQWHALLILPSAARRQACQPAAPMRRPGHHKTRRFRYSRRGLFSRAAGAALTACPSHKSTNILIFCGGLVFVSFCLSTAMFFFLCCFWCLLVFVCLCCWCCFFFCLATSPIVSSTPFAQRLCV